MTAENAALALAETRPKNKHGQLCPVWTQRLKKVRHAVTIAACDCWILADARVDAAVVAAALAAEPPALDVERLAKAMWNVLYPDPAAREANTNALCIAAEYARLAREVTPDVPDAARRPTDPDSRLAWALVMVGAFTVVDDSKQLCTMASGDINSVARRMEDWLAKHD